MKKKIIYNSLIDSKITTELGNTYYQQSDPLKKIKGWQIQNRLVPRELEISYLR